MMAVRSQSLKARCPQLVGSAGEEGRAAQQLKSTKAMGITFQLTLFAAAPTIK
jgi:hypothetical protein